MTHSLAANEAAVNGFLFVTKVQQLRLNGAPGALTRRNGWGARLLKGSRFAGRGQLALRAAAL